MTSPGMAAVDAVREQVKQYFEDHITHARDGAVQYLREVEGTAVDTVAAAAEQVTAPHVAATRQDREATAGHVVVAEGHAEDAAASAGLAATHAEGVSHAEARAQEHEDFARERADRAEVSAVESESSSVVSLDSSAAAVAAAKVLLEWEAPGPVLERVQPGPDSPVVDLLWDRIDANIFEHGEAAEAAAQVAVQARDDTVAAAETAAGEAAAGVTTHLESLTTRTESAADRAVDAAATAAQDTVAEAETLLDGKVTAAEAARDRAEAAAEAAEVGVADGAISKPKLAPDLRDEIEGKADQAATEQALSGKADVGHTHTAAQVGARPETWTPTAAEVGARPDDWVPTPGQVGAATPAYVDSQVATRATPAEVDGRIETIIGTAPENLDTLGEIADKLAEQDDVAAALTTQIAGKASKEHTHTAAQVGARPASWTPTASDVGARPDTWVPTAEQVGAATPDYVDSRVREVTGDDWPADPEPGVIYWQAE